MKKAIFALILTASCFAAPQKPAHVATESEMCWRDVRLYSEMDFPATTEDVLQRSFTRLYSCSETLKGDRFKSRIALQLAIAAAQSYDLIQREKQLKEAQQAQAASEQSVRNFAKAYVDLQHEYEAYQAATNKFIDQVSTYAATIPVQPTPQAEPRKRGVFANFAQGFKDGVAAYNARPTIHCESSTYGNQTSTDCK